MAIELSWDDDAQTVLVCRYLGAWSVEDIYDAVNSSSDILATVPYEVDIVLDFSRGAMNTELSAPIVSVSRKTPRNQRLLIVCGAPSLFKSLEGSASRTFQNIQFVRHMGEARDAIYDAREARSARARR
ncbi:MAG TPA: hypothetical protein VHL11_11925 [Phototrophicaceae bacterium]|nr:hypothetical protein [Phototrophicaceae bacterium]